MSLDTVDILHAAEDEIGRLESILEKIHAAMVVPFDWSDYTRWVDYHLYEIFLKDRDRAIADSINELFKNRNDLYSYNKKALYILIRERTGVHTQYITKVVGKLKLIYVELYTEYNKKGHLSLKYKLKDNNG